MVLNYNPDNRKSRQSNIFRHNNIDCCCHIGKPAEYWQLWQGFFDIKPITDTVCARRWQPLVLTVEVQHCARHSLRAQLEIPKNPDKMVETEAVNINAVIRDTVFNIQRV